MRGVADYHCKDLLFDSLDTNLWIFRKENKHLICVSSKRLSHFIFPSPVGSLLCSTKMERSARDG